MNENRDGLCFKITCETSQARLATIVEFAERLQDDLKRTNGRFFDAEIGTTIGTAYDALASAITSLARKQDEAVFCSGRQKTL